MKKTQPILFTSLEERESLYFMNMQELKKACSFLDLEAKGKKGEMIDRILHFAGTGHKKPQEPLPKASCAQKGVTYPLEPGTLMLKGSYKNDLKTRLFFKSLIGEHFHFTAFGIDWLEERWKASKPPTYAQFAQYWSQESAKRKKQEAQPKEEWAYLNFCNQFLKQYSAASRAQIAAAWKKERQTQAKRALGFIEKIQNALSGQS